MKTCDTCKVTYFNFSKKNSDFHIYSDTCKICEKNIRDQKQFMRKQKN